jgi:ring-1,2-phenylacetyl-CoA epoxidase subunit PaaE
MSLRFHPLRVEEVEPLTANAVRVTLAVPEEVRGEYEFSAGQHITIRHPDPATGQQLRRSYSLCQPPSADRAPDRLTIAIKRHGPGGFGDHAVGKLAPGDTIDVLTPLGHFRPFTRRGAHHVAIAAGSGITPIMAILAEILGTDPTASVALLYGNRTSADVMFLEEIADLKDRYGRRFVVQHVLSREDRGIELLTGRIDRERLPRLLDSVAAGPQDAYYLCGPIGLVDDARAVLGELGARDVRFELFDTPGLASARSSAGAASSAQRVARVSVNLSGRVTECELRPGDGNLLQAVLRSRPDAPYSCTGGVCGTCRARLTSGTAVMASDYALEPDEKTDGFVLACQALPTSDDVALDFDA